MRFGLVTYCIAALVSVPLWGQDPFAEMAKEAERQRQLTIAAHSICEDGKVEEVKKLIAAGWDVNQSFEGRKPLYHVIENGFTECVQLMIAAGARLNESTSSGDTALSIAASEPRVGSDTNSIKMIELLLAHGADVHAADEVAILRAAGHSLPVVKRLQSAGARLTPQALAVAVGAGQEEIVDYLLKQGVDPKAPLEDGNTLLHYLPGEAILKKLLALGLDVNAREKDGRTPLHQAASWGYETAAAALLNHGAEVNAFDHEKNTPLMFSAYNKSANITQLLIDRGADMKLLDKDGDTVLEWAWGLKSWDTVTLLLERGLKFKNAEKTLGDNMVELANSSFDAKEAAQSLSVLLKHVKMPSAVRPEGRPLLIWAVFLGQPEILEMFLKAGVPVDATDDEGRTALMWAAMTGADVLRHRLVAVGAQSGLQDGSGKRVEDWAKWREEMERAKQPGMSDGRVLSSVGATDTDSEGSFFSGIIHNRVDEVRMLLDDHPELMKLQHGGIPPLHLAAALGHREMMKLLLARGAKLDEKSVTAESPVMLAVSGGQVEAVIWLLDQAPASSHHVMFEEAAAHAVVVQQNRVLSRLVQDGWRPKRGKSTISAYEVALARKDEGLLRQLFESGALLEPTIKDDPCGTDLLHTLLSEFARSTDNAMFRVLYQHLDAALVAKYPGPLAGMLMRRASEGDLHGMEMCLQWKGVSVNSRVTSGLSREMMIAPPELERFETALSSAVSSGKLEAAKYLIGHGARLEGQTASGDPLLHAAAKAGDVPMARLLLQHGASRDLKDQQGRTALQVAEERAQQAMIELLQAKPSSPKQP